MIEQKEILFYNTNIEYAILSSIVFDNDSIDAIEEKLNPGDFYLPANKHAYEAMLSLREDGKPIDEVFLLERLSKTEKYAEAALIEILSANPISNVTAYIEMLKELTQKRMLMNIHISIRKALDDEVDPQKVLIDTLDMIEDTQNISSIAQKDRKMSEITQEIRDDMAKAQSGEKMPYYASGYPAFDSVIGGLVENGLTVVAGRPSMGKSSFTSGPIVNTLESGDAAVLYSMEVADKNALTRLVSFKSQEPLSYIKQGLVNGLNEFNSAMSFFEENDDNFKIVERNHLDF